MFFTAIEIYVQGKFNGTANSFTNPDWFFRVSTVNGNIMAVFL